MSVHIPDTRGSGAFSLLPSLLGRGARTAALGAALLLVGACGGEDTAQGPAGSEAGETPPVSAEREGAAGEGTTGAETGRPPSVSECLELAQASEYEQALSVCADAAKAAPRNAEVQEALREARSATGEAAGSAREGAGRAADEAGRRLGGSGEGASEETP